MSAAQWALLAWVVLSMLLVVGRVGRPRRPLTNARAALGLLECGVLIALVASTGFGLLQLVLIAWFVLEGLVAVASIGKPRPGVQPSTAAGAVFILALLGVAVVSL